MDVYILVAMVMSMDVYSELAVAVYSDDMILNCITVHNK